MSIGAAGALLLLVALRSGLPMGRRAWRIYIAGGIGLFGSVLGFVLYFYALKNLGAARVSLITLVTPVLSLLLGQWVNGETPTLQTWFGSGLILAGLAAHQWPAISGLYQGARSLQSGRA